VSSTDNLKTKARFLRNAAPRAYDEFFDAFAEYTGNAATILVEATQNWQLYQGHAQQCKKLMKVLEEVKNG
jgi:hypothetical protein